MKKREQNAKNGEKISKAWYTFNWNSRRKRERSRRNNEVIMVENLPKMTDTKLPIQEAQRTSSRIHTTKQNKTTPKKIIAKLY